MATASIWDIQEFCEAIEEFNWLLRDCMAGKSPSFNRKDADLLGRRINEPALRLGLCDSDGVPYVAPAAGRASLLVRPSPDTDREEPVSLPATKRTYRASQADATSVVTYLNEWMLRFDGKVMERRPVPMAAPNGCLEGATGRLLAAVLRNRDVLMEALSLYPPDSPERWQVLDSVAPRYSEPEKSLFAWALVEARQAGELTTFSPLIQEVKDSWLQLLGSSVEAAGLLDEKWATAFHRFNEAVNVLGDRLLVFESAELPGQRGPKETVAQEEAVTVMLDTKLEKFYVNDKEWPEVTSRMFRIFEVVSEMRGSPYTAKNLEKQRISSPREVAPQIPKLFEAHRVTNQASVISVEKRSVEGRLNWVFCWHATPVKSGKNRAIRRFKV